MSTSAQSEVHEKPLESEWVAGSGKSSTASMDDWDALEQASVHETGEAPEPMKCHQQSVDLKRVTSNALSRVASRMTTRSWPEPPPPPDGGLKAWTQVAMGWLVIFTSWGLVNSYGCFQDYYTLHLGVSASTVSWIGSIQNWFTFFLGAFSGRLLDAGLFVPTLIVGATIQIIGIFTWSVSTKYWQIMLTQGILTGIGNGIYFTPSMGLVGTYFSNRRALAVGLATTGNSAGGIIYPLLVQQLLPKLGFAWTVRVIGFMNLGCLCIVIAFMRPRLPPRKSGPFIDPSAFKEAPYAFFVAALFFALWGNYYTFYYIASFGYEITGLPFAAATTIVIALNGAGMPARIIVPFFADRLGQLNVILPILSCFTVVAFCWLAVDSIAGVWVFTCCYGLTSGAFQCLFPSTIASLTPDMKKFGTRLGMAFSTLSFAALTGPPIGGAIQAAQGGSFTGANAFAAAATAMALACLVASRVAKAGWVLGIKC